MSSRGGDLASLRRHNAAAVLDVLRHDGRPTLRELAAGTGLSRPTVEAALARLTRDGWVAALPPAAGGVGRPARRYRFRSEARTVLGLELGARHVRAIAADLDGGVGGEERVPVAAGTAPGDRLDAACAAATAALAAAGVEPGGAAAAAAGTPGVVGADGTVTASVLPGWTGVALATELEVRLGCPVRAENDANLAVLGEHWRGAAAGVRDAIFVLLATEVGAGVLIDGRLHRGAHGAAGEIAHQDSTGDPSALARLDAATVSAAAGGDAAAIELVRAAVPRVADDVRALALAIDPELVVVGGGPAVLTAALGAGLERALAGALVPGPRLALSTTGERAVALGAVRHALDAVEQELLPAPGRPHW